MEKRLLEAYDHMTMPEDCTRRIEARLQAELDGKQTGQYTKTIPPSSPHRSSWAAAAACLLLVLVMGGAGLNLWMRSAVVEIPEEQLTDYSVATDIPAGMVEDFAAEIRKNLLEEDWEAFSEKVQYPISILVRGLGDDTEVRERYITGDGGGMVGLFLRNAVNSSFLEEIRREDCKNLFCNQQGICMADGRIWINEVDGQLKVTAINGVFADTADLQSFSLKLGPDGYIVTEYSGKEPEIVIPGGKNQNRVTAIGTGEPVIRHGDKVKVIQIPETIRTVERYAFANCPALESVFFEGDAPPEASGVFEGSENVTVYYQKDARGWGDTWCGRKTMEYDGGYLSLGTVTVQDRVPVLFQAVLSGEPVNFYGNSGEITVAEFCTARWGEDAAANAFALADMDRDGICELVFSVRDAEGGSCGYLVLRQDGGVICGYTLRSSDLYDLTKDGTFYCSYINGEARLYFQGKDGYSIETGDFSMQDKPLAQWHIYPCQTSALVLESYRYASETGFSTYPGNPYYYFRTLIYREADWNNVQPWLSHDGVYREQGDTFYAFDPDTPGCGLYGTLTGEGDQKTVTSAGYYICGEDREYRAEVFDLDQPEPIYTIDPPADDRGREVDTPEAILAYLGHAPYYDDINRDAQSIAELLDRFVYLYTVHDTEGMKEYMADTAGDFSSYPFAGSISILSFGILPDTAVSIGETWATTVELLESGEPGVTYHLDVILIKQNDGWKIRSYALEKQ